MDNIFSIALAFFLLANPIGNCPAIVAVLKGIDFERQKKIMVRESFFAIIIAFFFLFLGDLFLTLINVKLYTIQVTGGMLLFIVAFEMIFPRHQDAAVFKTLKEPYIVPIATPLISGPALLTIVMLKSHEENHLMLVGAICIAWIGVTAVLASAPYLQRVLGKRGLTTLEQLMGMLLAMLAINSAISGIRNFIQVVNQG